MNEAWAGEEGREELASESGSLRRWMSTLHPRAIRVCGTGCERWVCLPFVLATAAAESESTRNEHTSI